MSAIFKREFKSYFTTPIGYIVLAVMMIVHGWAFADVYEAGSPDISYVFTSFLSTLIVFILIPPILTMRSMSEDRRQKVDQALLTAPVSLTSIVMGKFFAALALFAIGFAPTVIFEIIVASYVSVNIMSYIYALFGMLLLGSALIAIGMFISSLTESPIISIIFTLIANLFIMFSGAFAGMITVPTTTSNIFAAIGAGILKVVVSFLNGMNFLAVLESFGEQSFAIKDVIFFLSIIAAFIFLTERSLEKRRWS